jgi:hypothetical protein
MEGNGRFQKLSGKNFERKLSFAKCFYCCYVQQMHQTPELLPVQNKNIDKTNTYVMIKAPVGSNPTLSAMPLPSSVDAPETIKTHKKIGDCCQ